MTALLDLMKSLRDIARGAQVKRFPEQKTNHETKSKLPNKPELLLVGQSRTFI
jgi:hypothetical protein